MHEQFGSAREDYVEGLRAELKGLKTAFSLMNLMVDSNGKVTKAAFKDENGI